MRSIWPKVLVILAALWLVVGGFIWLTGKIKPTPDSVTRYIATHPLFGKPAAERTAILQALGKKLNQMEYKERNDPRVRTAVNGVFATLDRDEQSRFLDLTLPSGMKQMMEAFNKMDSVRRKQVVNKAMEDMRRQEVEQPRTGERDANEKKIIEMGLQSFFSDASAETKLDFAPLIEQMQKTMQFR